MGGHGGLNILPQKRWNVYNFDNREKVRKDEEAAAREEQLKREQSRRREAEFRLHRLRRARGLSPDHETNSSPSGASHINLFEGLSGEAEPRLGADADDRKKRRKEESVRVVGPDDEKYRLGYGVAGKGVKVPWYLARPITSSGGGGECEVKGVNSSSGGEGSKKKDGKKSIEELRAERLSREKKEKERERELMRGIRRKEREEEEVGRRSGYPLFPCYQSLHCQC